MLSLSTGRRKPRPDDVGIAARHREAYSQPMQSPATTGPSRREFLGTAALGLLGMTRATPFASLPNEQELLYVGSYTDAKRAEGVALVQFDTRSGALRLLRSCDAGPNPSFLAIHPNGRVLYAVNEVAERLGQRSGAVSAFSIASDGALARVGEQSSQGAGPCYISVDRSGRVVLVANYDGGSVALLPIGKGGGLAPATSVDQHQGHGPDAERQEAAHAHCIVSDPSNRFALAADLGLDRVMLYRLDVAAGSLQHVADGDAALSPGAGPRHIAFHPRQPLVYVVGELDSTVTTLRFDANAGRLTTFGSQSSLPGGWSGKSYAADIHVAPAGDVLYVSNRGHDSIAVVSIAQGSGALRLEQTIATGGAWPRNFTLDPTGRWLLVANQNSGSIVVLARDPRSGQLSPTSQRLEIASPVCLRFRAHTGVT
jgi:6-phosphogluconolactonase